MKKAVLGFTLALLSAQTLPQAQAATLVLQGSVAVNCVLNSVSTSAFGSASTTLPIVAGTSSTAVADASVTCNNINGYSLEATSGNGLSRLAHSDQPSLYYTQYELEIAGTGSTGFKALSSTPTVLKQTTLSSPVTNQSSNINIKVQAIATAAMAGTYEDTVTITLTAL